VLNAAAHVLYQSEFCKRSADELVAEPAGSWEVLYNAVDVEHFVPAATAPAQGPVVVLYGDQTQAYRLELALRTFARVRRTEPDARLLITGRLVSDAAPLVEELRIGGAVDLVGRYRQREAPAILQRAHVLLHTKVNDPCPSAVIEAMACGVPVVYPASGGTVELVADEAGIGVAHRETWERDEPPPPEALAEAVGLVLASHVSY
jgi:glycosyltransferase involved in cell wall biosynthesis